MWAQSERESLLLSDSRPQSFNRSIVLYNGEKRGPIVKVSRRTQKRSWLPLMRAQRITVIRTVCH
jgi:hypothetical protein